MTLLACMVDSIGPMGGVKKYSGAPRCDHRFGDQSVCSVLAAESLRSRRAYRYIGLAIINRRHAFCGPRLFPFPNQWAGRPALRKLLQAPALPARPPHLMAEPRFAILPRMQANPASPVLFVHRIFSIARHEMSGTLFIVAIGRIYWIVGISFLHSLDNSRLNSRTRALFFGIKKQIRRPTFLHGAPLLRRCPLFFQLTLKRPAGNAAYVEPCRNQLPG
jgi:hypothetical protein